MEFFVQHGYDMSPFYSEAGLVTIVRISFSHQKNYMAVFIVALFVTVKN